MSTISEVLKPNPITLNDLAKEARSLRASLRGYTVASHEEDDTMEEILQAKLLSHCYRFLSACFCQPQKDVLIEEGTLDSLGRYLELVCPEAAPFCRDMERELLNTTDEDLLVEYARLFVGPFELVAPPYGSIYLDNVRTVMGDSTMQVIAAYESEGLSGSAGLNEPPDHVSVELEFMSYLLHQKATRLEKRDPVGALSVHSKQRDFLLKILRVWVPHFCDQIQKGTDSGFYAALAGCLSAFVMCDATR